MARYLKKLGENKLRLFGWTPALSARKEMVECDVHGSVLRPIMTEKDKANLGLKIDPLKIFKVGMKFQLTDKKHLRKWIEDNAADINLMGLGIQGMIIARWEKSFGAEKMPESCTFMTMGKPDKESTKNYPVNMDE